MKKELSIGTEVKIVNCFFFNWIGLKGKIIATTSQNPHVYRLDIGGEWLDNELEKV